MDPIKAYSIALTHEVTTNPSFVATLQSDPQMAIAKVEQKIDWPREVPDTWIYRIVVLAFGIAIVGIVVGVLIITSTVKPDATVDKMIPTILTAIGSGAIGALSGLLAPSPVAK